MIANVSSSWMLFVIDDDSKLPGMILFKTKPSINADKVLIITVLIIGEPVLCCTVVSKIILCEQSTITDNIVAARVLKSNVVITAMAE